MSVGLLLDVGSIQHYIFGSNKLKENIGASYIVEHIFDEFKVNTLEGPTEIVYRAGGNALLIFNTQVQAIEFLNDFTTDLMFSSPGMIVFGAVAEWTNDDKKFGFDLDNLHKKLKHNKGLAIPQTTLPRHGITAPCPRTGLSAEAIIVHQEKNLQTIEWVSSMVISKITNVEKATTKLSEICIDILSETYVFPTELEDLGQNIGFQNTIAVVHIDGNGMGDRFKEAATESKGDFIELSEYIGWATETSLAATVKSLIDFLDGNEKFKARLKKEGEKYLLPFRPLILGGDDITFVCEGTMGIWLAQTFITHFSEKEVSDGKPLSACAGVAIVKTKYPFFKAYQLAEELCSNAKIKAKGIQDSSWIDFQHIMGNGASELSLLRKEHYTVKTGSNEVNLISRPFKLGKDFEGILTHVNELRSWPNSLRKELRDVLYSSQTTKELFEARLAFRNDKLPKGTDLSENRNLLLDLIELIDWYPQIQENNTTEVPIEAQYV